jgi:S1-C subfamily serine protease
MNHAKKTLLIIIAVIVVILGVYSQNFLGTYYTKQSNTPASGSVVYIENGVSGVVTVTDPYLNRSTDINVIYDPLDSGSGFIVNSNGYIVTAFHVVGDPVSIQNLGKLKLMDSADVQLYLERAAVTGYISKYDPQLGTSLISNGSSSSPVIQNQPDVNATTDIMVQRNLLQVKSSQQQIKVRLPGSTNGDSINADLIDVGDAATSEDVALIKIDGLFKKLNPLTLNSNKPSTNDNIQIFGYPVNNQEMYSNSDPSPLQPSSSSGVVTNELPNQGSVYFETTAPTVHGFSGGPVVDKNNNVLGIIIYSIVSSNNPQQSGSSVFLSSDYIIQICNRNNVSTNIV